ncbi:MAG TPA: hypothetical protein VGB67_06380, partial [Fibrella sp.]
MLVSTSNTVVSTKGISAGGAYTFGRVNTGTYNVMVSGTNPAVGSTMASATYPTNYKSTGENLGTAAGHDGLVNGKLPVTVGSVSVTQANLGIQLPPATADTVISGGLRNPGSYNVIPLTGKFNITELDGTIDSITITGYPSNTNFLKVGSTFYHNGGTRPPQVATANWIPFPSAGVKTTYAQIATMGVDPSASGSGLIAFPFKVMDNARMWSNNGGTSTVTINFQDLADRRVNGYIWHDVNGDGKRKNHENYLSFSMPNQQLYALLIQTSNTYSGLPTLYAATPVNASESGYEFDKVPEGNTYEVRYSSLATSPAPGTALSAITINPGTGWTCVTTTYKNDTVSYAPAGTTTPVIFIDTLQNHAEKLNFGMEKTPTADPKSFTASTSAFVASPYTIGGQPTIKIPANSAALTGSSVKSLSGKDPEDCATTSSCNTGKTFVIDSIKDNTLLAYNFGTGPVLIPEDTTIQNFNVANLTIIGDAGSHLTPATSLGFTYSLADSSGVESAPVTYQLMSTIAPLPITLETFDGSIS